MQDIVYSGFHTVKRLKTRIKGKDKIIESLGVKSAIGAIVIDSIGNICLVKQYRPCINETTYEIPAGLMDKEGKNPIQIITEELYEECDISKKEIEYIRPICEYYMLCGSSDAKMQLYYVGLNTEKHSKKVSDNDVEEVIWFTMDEFKVLCMSGIIKDSKTMMCYYYLQTL